jgi:hypothetical protein
MKACTRPGSSANGRLLMATGTREVRPWVVALQALCAFPATVLGPVESRTLPMVELLRTADSLVGLASLRQLIRGETSVGGPIGLARITKTDRSSGSGASSEGCVRPAGPRLLGLTATPWPSAPTARDNLRTYFP